jgi:hypothetical protein
MTLVSGGARAPDGSLRTGAAHGGGRSGVAAAIRAGAGAEASGGLVLAAYFVLAALRLESRFTAAIAPLFP